MCEKNSDIIEKIPSGCPSPATIEKTDNNSSRESGSSSHWDFEEACITFRHLNRDGRIRQSSWDDSDNDLSPEPERSPISSCLYSNDSKQFKGSVSFEINELKKQFFESLEKMRDKNDTQELENLRDKIESKLHSDRRQSPARMRRRTKSSSSSSPVLESKSHNSPEKVEKLNESEAVLEEISTKVLELDSKFYLNNFFTEIRSKRISLMDSIPVIGKVEKPSDYDNDSGNQISNEIISPDPNENDEYFCKTSRKLSKILEVEENKTDLEKSSEEKLDNSELFSKTLKNPEEKHISPLQTARSKKSQKISDNIKESKTKKEEKYKSLSYEEFENFLEVEKFPKGSLSERSTMIFSRKINNNFNALSANMDSFNDKKSFTSPSESNMDFFEETNIKVEEKEKNFASQECLNIDLMKGFTFENSTPKKSTDRSERTYTSRTMSSKSKRSINTQSPKFTINIGKDSDRSLRIEDIGTPDSSRKDSKVKTYTELKTPSIEECSSSSSKKYDKRTGRTEDRFKSKTERNLQSSLKSPSLESLKSSYGSSKERDINYLKSHRSRQISYKKEKKQEENNQNIVFETNESNLNFSEEKAESSSSVESSRSYGSPHNKPDKSGSFIKITNVDISNSYENQSSSKSSRSSKSDKIRTLKLTEDDQLYDQGTSKNNKILELDLPLKISGRPESGKESYRSLKAVELDDITKDLSETNLIKRTSRRASERSLSSRSRNTESRKSTPRNLKISSRTSSCSSSRSKDSLENRDDSGNVENLHSVAWKELENSCGTVNNHALVSSASSRSSWRELETPSQQNSYRKKLFTSEPECSDIIVASKNNDTLEERLPRNRSSKRFSDSQTLDFIKNNNSDRSIRPKSRPTSWNSEEHKILDIHSEVEKLNMDEMNEKAIDKFFTFKEDEEQEKSSPIENGTERGRNSKRLSVINEVSFEDLKVSNENEEDVGEHSGKYSRRSNKQLSPQSVKKTSKNSVKSLKENSLDELSSKVNSPDDGKWNALIEKFCQNSNSSCALESTFPSFSHEKENSFDSARDMILKENTENKEYHENPVDYSTLSKRPENKYETLGNNLSSEKVFEEKDALNLEFKEPLLKKDLKEKDIHSVKKSQNVFYFNLNKERPFGIGEFGDVTCWNACKSDTIDFQKPKDHGDGAQTQKTSEVLILPEKRLNEAKTQRNLWTELRKDFRDSKPLLNKLYLETDDHADFTHFIPANLKTSKSDNCIKLKMNAENDFQTPPTCKFLNEYNDVPKKTENKFLESENCKKRKKEEVSAPKSVTEKHPTLENSDLEKEDSENQEFDCEITPRLSKSMSNFETQFEEDSFVNRELNESFSTSRTQLFEKKINNVKDENEMTDLNIFLTNNQKVDKVIFKSNWLNFKNSEKEKLREQDKKKKKRKNVSSSKEPFHEYLYSRKSESNVPHLKLRNSNCFQNFYKRFISVFCLTSHSSSTTSK